MSKDDGGAAFPSPGVVIDYDKNEHQQGAYEGMSLRDYFAAKAMQIAYDGHAPEYLAEVAYQMADAMLAERAVEPKSAAPQGLLEAVKALIAAEGGISIVSQKSADAFEKVRRIAERAK